MEGKNYYILNIFLIMVKYSKTDVRAAMKDVIRSEMAKQQKGEMDRQMEGLYAESYADECPYCQKLTEVNAPDIEEGKKTAKIETVKEKKYLTDTCTKCGKKIYVRIVMSQPLSMLDAPSPRGYFFTEEYVMGDKYIEPVNVIKHGFYGSIFKTK